MRAMPGHALADRPVQASPKSLHHVSSGPPARFKVLACLVSSPHHPRVLEQAGQKKATSLSVGTSVPSPAQLRLAKLAHSTAPLVFYAHQYAAILLVRPVPIQGSHQLPGEGGNGGALHRAGLKMIGLLGV